VTVAWREFAWALGEGAGLARDHLQLVDKPGGLPQEIREKARMYRRAARSSLEHFFVTAAASLELDEP
jgi:hypothetical protein